MKIIRKLLRLLPFFIILLMCLVGIFNLRLDNVDNFSGGSTETKYSNYFDTACIRVINTCNKCNTFILQGLPGFIIDIENNIGTWILQDDDFDISADLGIISFVLNTLVYELFLSFMFLIFDVFNFIISIASNWLRKGESLNE